MTKKNFLDTALLMAAILTLIHPGEGIVARILSGGLAFAFLRLREWNRRAP